MTEYFVGCLWLAGMYAVAIRRNPRGRVLLCLASLTPAWVACVAGHRALFGVPGQPLGVPLAFCFVLGTSCLIFSAANADAAGRRHFLLAALILFGPVLLLPLTLIFHVLL